MDWDSLAIVGRVARAHGIRGQVIVNPETDFPGERFAVGSELFLDRHGIVTSVTVTALRLHRGRPIVGLSGIETMTAAEDLAGCELAVPRARLQALPAGSFYRHDLVGCRVETADGRSIGVVRGVEGDTGGSRLLVAHDGGDVLIPFVQAICTTIDPVRRLIVIDPPEGLIDLNRR